MATYTVPDNVEQLFIECWGGGSQTADGEYVAEGGYAAGLLDVTPGETLHYYEGEFGDTDPQAGGASDVRQGGDTLDDRVIVAGGAGGAGDVRFAGDLPEERRFEKRHAVGDRVDEVVVVTLLDDGGVEQRRRESVHARDTARWGKKGGVGRSDSADEVRDGLGNRKDVLADEREVGDAGEEDEGGAETGSDAE